MESICRLCLSSSCNSLHQLIGNNETVNKINTLFSLDVSLNRCLPSNVCDKCCIKLEDFSTFRLQFIRNEETLLEYLSKGTEHLKKYFITLKSKENDFNYLPHISVKNELDFNTSKVKSDLKLKQNTIKLSVQTKSFKNYTNSETSKTTNSALKSDDFRISKFRALSKIKVKCLTCFKMYESQSLLLKHYLSQHSLQKLEIPDSSYMDIGNKFKCVKCDKIFDSKKDLDNHYLSHINYSPFLCRLCGRLYKTAAEIVRHGKAHRNLKLPCSYKCGFSTAYLGALKEHESRHRTEYKYVCKQCKKGFQVKTWYEQHQNIHKGVKPYKCDVCDLAFHMERYLKTHKKNLHKTCQAENKYICTICNSLFDTKTSLTKHLEVHGFVSKCLCDLCGRTFKSNEQLKLHVDSHLGKKNRYKCSICSKDFSKKHNLKIHEGTHMGVYHSCSECNKRFTQKSALLRHSRSRCKVSHRCSTCKKIFKTSSILLEHKKSCAGLNK